ncbi:NAD(+) diphosphatase [Actinomyces trachealis]|uniref:NAD(+) diphosphatase n=1 Tax=Actinomyces trachealis TaxID=2763540 RepID=UPI0018928DCB|nr:NAD(+) diphosphatase [Actinomyces trachealis]
MNTRPDEQPSPASPRPAWFRSLSRHTTDRDSARHGQPGLLTTLVADATTRVLLVDARGRVALAESAGVMDLPDNGLTPSAPSDADYTVWARTGVVEDAGEGAAEGTGPRLAPLTIGDLPDPLRGELALAAQEPATADTCLQLLYLGQETVQAAKGARATAWLGVVVPAATAAEVTLGTPTAPVPQGDGGTTCQDEVLLGLLACHPLTALRAVGAELDAHDAGLATPAIALAAWHTRTRFCPACGGRMTPVQAGWARACQACDAVQFPRTDPAVIMAVTDDADRLLLVHGATWPERRYSVVAGFVEAGESAEQAVHREVWEETSLRVASVEAFATQPWPFPRSLMLGYRARLAEGEELPVPDGREVTAAMLVSRAELVAAVQEGRIGLPGPTSIARALIDDWLGGSPLEQNASTRAVFGR